MDDWTCKASLTAKATRLSARALSQTHWGSLHCSPDPIAGLRWGPRGTGRRRGGEKEEGEGRDGKGLQGRRGRPGMPKSRVGKPKAHHVGLFQTDIHSQRRRSWGCSVPHFLAVWGPTVVDRPHFLLPCCCIQCCGYALPRASPRHLLVFKVIH